VGQFEPQPKQFDRSAIRPIESPAGARWSRVIFDQRLRRKCVRGNITAPLPASAWQSCAARRSPTAHDLSSTKILYRHHPCYGLEVDVVRHLRRSSSAILIVRLPDGVPLAVAEWMLNRQACQYLTDQPEARIAIEALEELRSLVDSQTLTSDRLTSGRAESSAGGNHAQPQKGKRRAVATPFEESEIWGALPEQVREGCRSLWRQLLTRALEPDERRQNERED